jgi:hypothetical protein
VMILLTLSMEPVLDRSVGRRDRRAQVAPSRLDAGIRRALSFSSAGWPVWRSRYDDGIAHADAGAVDIEHQPSVRRRLSAKLRPSRTDSPM